MGAAQRDQGVHPRVTAQPLHVVARDDAPEGVPDDVDALVTGLLTGGLDQAGQSRRGGADVLGEGAVVDGADLAEAPAPQRTTQQREDRPVVDQSVHQQDRRAGRDDVTQQQPALHGGEVGEGEPLRQDPVVGPRLLAQDAQRVQHAVRRDPGQLGARSAQARGGAQRAHSPSGGARGPREGGAGVAHGGPPAAGQGTPGACPADARPCPARGVADVT